MEVSNTTILSTRILSQSSKIILNDNGIQLHDHNFVNIKYLSTDSSPMMSIHTSLIFTSVHGIIGALPYLERDKWANYKTYCIGGKTKSFAIKNGLVVANQANNGSDLAVKIIEDKPKVLTYFTKSNHRKELENSLALHNISVDKLFVYEDDYQYIKTESIYNGIAFFSPSQVRTFRKVNTINNDAVLFCIGATTADSVSDLTNKTIIASFPSEEALINTIIQYYTQPN